MGRRCRSPLSVAAGPGPPGARPLPGVQRLLRQEAISGSDAPGVNTALTPRFLQHFDVPLGNDPADDDEHVLEALGTQALEHSRNERQVRPGRQGQPDRVGVLLEAVRTTCSGV